MADIVITLSGVLHAVLHVLMRTNSERFAIRSRRTIWTTKRKIRIFGPNDLNIAKVISTPLLGQATESQWGFTDDGKYENEKLRRSSEFSHNSTSPRPQDIGTAKSVPSPHTQFMPMTPQTSNMRQAQKKSSYSIFPPQHETCQNHRSWASDESTASIEIQIPSPLFSKNRRREDSIQTSATVEIGMRFSNPPPDYYTPARAYLAPLQTIRFPSVEEVESPVVPENPRIVILPELQRSGPSTPERLRNSFTTTSKALKPMLLSSPTGAEQQRQQQTMKSLPPVPRTGDLLTSPEQAGLRSSPRKQTPEPSPHFPSFATTLQSSPLPAAPSWRGPVSRKSANPGGDWI